MANAEILLHTIFGSVRSDIRPLAFAIDTAGGLLFSQHLSMDDIRVTKDIYAEVAKQFRCKLDTASRRIERLALNCWDALKEQELVSFYFGRDIKYFPTAGSLIIYLAFYSHWNTPYFTVMEHNPHFLFQPPADDMLLPAPSAVQALLRDRPLRVSKVIAFPDSSSYPVCPNCNTTLEREYQRFCDRCGQRLDWRDFEHAQIIYPD